MHDLSVTPSTLEQFQSSIVECFGTVSKGARSPFKFTRAPKSVQLSLIPHSKVDVKLEMKDQYVLIQVKDRRLTMNLEGFLVTTAVQGQTLCLNIKKDRGRYTGCCTRLGEEWRRRSTGVRFEIVAVR